LAVQDLMVLAVEAEVVHNPLEQWARTEVALVELPQMQLLLLLVLLIQAVVAEVRKVQYSHLTVPLIQVQLAEAVTQK
jgi:hypothetical protein